MQQAKPNRSFAVLKPFKLCFNNEIHRLSTIPDSYESLKENFRLVFKDTLPPKWALQYDDSDGDRIMLTNEDDFQSMLECEAQSDSKSIRIYVVSTEVKEEEQSVIQESLPPHSEEKRISFNDISKVESVMYCPNFKVEEDASICSKLEKLEPQKNDEKDDHLAKKLEDKNEDEESKIYVVGEKILEDDEEDVKNSRELIEKMNPNETSRVEDSKRESKKEKLRELMREDMPYIADLMQSYFIQQRSFEKEPEPLKKESKQNDIIIDNKVACKGCGANPITGFIYKCSVCEDFFYCAKCEENKDHVHPFLKVRNAKQIPKAILALFEEDVPKSCSLIKLSAVVTHDSGDSHIEKFFELKQNAVEEQKRKQEEFLRKQKEEEERCLKIKIDEEKRLLKEKIEQERKIAEEKRIMEERVREERLFVEKAEREATEAKEEAVRQEERFRREKEEAERMREEMRRKMEEEERRWMEEEERKKQEAERKKKEEMERLRLAEEERRRFEEEMKKIEEEKRKTEELKRASQSAHNVSLVRELNTIPAEVKVKDRHIYKTVSLRNTGTKDWPLSSVFRNVSGLKGSNVRGIPLPVGAECSVVLIVENPGKAGEFTSTWSLACNDEKGELKNVGSPFNLTITVLPEGKKEVKEVKEVPKYDQATVENARAVKEIFPEQDIDQILEFISKNPKKSLEELIDHYMN